MNWIEVEKRFNRAFQHSFSKSTFLLTLPILVLCSTVIIFGKSIALFLSPWMSMSFIFLSIFVLSGILLSLGVLLVRIYYHEVKKIKIRLGKIIGKSWEIIIGASYISIPTILGYVLLWIFLGIFALISQIPKFGEAIGVILAFGPFILIFIAIILCVSNLVILFFVTPVIGLKSLKRFQMAKSVILKFKENIFFHVISLSLGVFPLLFVSYLLYITANLTHLQYALDISNASNAIRGFFVSIPFCAILSPFVVFFFNFAAEMQQLFEKK